MTVPKDFVNAAAFLVRLIADELLFVEPHVADRRCDETRGEWLSNGSTRGMSCADA